MCDGCIGVTVCSGRGRLYPWRDLEVSIHSFQLSYTLLSQTLLTLRPTCINPWTTQHLATDCQHQENDRYDKFMTDNTFPSYIVLSPSTCFVRHSQSFASYLLRLSSPPLRQLPPRAGGASCRVAKDDGRSGNGVGSGDLKEN